MPDQSSNKPRPISIAYKNGKLYLFYYIYNSSNSHNILVYDKATNNLSKLTASGFNSSNANTPYTGDILVDSINTPYILYKNAASTAIVQKYNSNTQSWDTIGDSFYFANDYEPQLAIDSNDKLYVVYADASKKLHVKSYNTTSSAWEQVGSSEIATLDSSTELHSFDIAIDENNTPYLAFIESTIDSLTVLKRGSDGIVYEIAENTKLITDINATDPETESANLIYTVVSGVDQNAFEFDGSKLVFKDANIPDYEANATNNTAHSDANHDNVYEVIINVSDGVNDINKTISVTITNASSETSFTSGNGADSFDVTIAENTSTITTLSATNFNNSSADVNYTITGGTDSALFSIDNSTGELTLLSNADYENKSSYEVIVTATADGESDTQTINVTVNDINEAPSITSTAITNATENSAYSYTITATDPENDVLGWSNSILPSWLSINNSSEWNEKTGSDNPFDGEDVGYQPNIAFVDIDNDGDMDMFAGNSWGEIRYFKNDGSSNFTHYDKYNSSNLFYRVDVGTRSRIGFADMDDDGDFDIYVGDQAGKIHYFENTGDINNPSFTQRTNGDNPMDGVDVGGYAIPQLVDFDKDGDIDMFIGESGGYIRYYKNIGSKTLAIFELNKDENPIEKKDFGTYPAPGFADLDGDGDLDIHIGVYDGTFKFYRNDGGTVLSGTPTVSGIYPVSLVVSDGELNATQNFNITVSDVNDAPVLNNASFVISENNASGSIVGSMLASDEDGVSPSVDLIGNPEVFTYSITAGNTNNDFAIDSSTGIITIANPLNAYNVSS